MSRTAVSSMVSLFAAVIAISTAHAQSSDPAAAPTDVPQLIITANRVAMPAETVGRSVEVRRENEIQAHQQENLPQALQDVEGVRTEEIGGPGSPGLAPLEIRGFRTSGTQLLLNGLTLHDPSSVSGTFENYLPHISTEAIESIEVLKGGSSVLYGSDGQAGAVSIITKRPEPGVHATGSLSGGSFDTFRETALLNAGNSTGGLLATMSRTDSSGLGKNTDYNDTTVFALGEYKAVPDRLTVSPLFSLIDAHNDLQTGPTLDMSGTFVPSRETDRNNSDSEAYLAGVTLDGTLSDSSRNKTSVYYNNSDRRYFFDFDGFESRGHYEGATFNVDSQQAFDLDELSSELVTGVLYEHQSTDTTSDGPTDSHQRDTMAAFVHNQWDAIPERLAVGGGGRLSHVSSIDKTFGTLEGSASLRIPETASRLHSSISQGFRSPTLFESSGTMVDYATGELMFVGNPDLNPEESLSTDFGLEQEVLPGELTADITFFQIDADETIVYDFANNTHVNGGGGKTQGVEASLSARLNAWLSLRGAYTNLDKAEELNGGRRQRTPRNWFAVSALAELEQWTLGSIVRYRDSQDLNFFGSSSSYEEGAATVFDLSASYALSKGLELFVRGENIFDEDYTEAGYQMPGASVYAGIKFGFTAETNAVLCE